MFLVFQLYILIPNRWYHTYVPKIFNPKTTHDSLTLSTSSLNTDGGKQNFGNKVCAHRTKYEQARAGPPGCAGPRNSQGLDSGTF